MPFPPHAYIYRRSLGRMWGGRQTTASSRPRPGKGNTVRGQAVVRGIAYVRPVLSSRTTTIAHMNEVCDTRYVNKPDFHNYPTEKETTMRNLSRCIPAQRVRRWAFPLRPHSRMPEELSRYCSTIPAQQRRQIVCQQDSGVSRIVGVATRHREGYCTMRQSFSLVPASQR